MKLIAVEIIDTTAKRELKSRRYHKISEREAILANCKRSD